MKRILLALIILCSTTAFAQATDSGNRQSIIALEHAWDQALERGDIKALSAIFDSSMLYIDYDGHLLTKAEYLLRVKTNNLHLQQVVTDQMDVQMFGNTAIVIGLYKIKGMEKGKPYAHRGRFMDTWILIGRNWTCVASTATPILE
jgi:ketosteroid isomerase-like protein